MHLKRSPYSCRRRNGDLGWCSSVPGNTWFRCWDLPGSAPNGRRLTSGLTPSTRARRHRGTATRSAPEKMRGDLPQRSRSTLTPHPTEKGRVQGEVRNERLGVKVTRRRRALALLALPLAVAGAGAFALATSDDTASSAGQDTRPPPDPDPMGAIADMFAGLPPPDEHAEPPATGRPPDVAPERSGPTRHPPAQQSIPATEAEAESYADGLTREFAFEREVLDCGHATVEAYVAAEEAAGQPVASTFTDAPGDLSLLLTPRIGGCGHERPRVDLRVAWA